MVYNTKDILIVASPGCLDSELDSLESIIAGHDAMSQGFLIDIDMTLDGLPVLCQNGKFICQDGNDIVVSTTSYFDIRNAFKKVVAIGQAFELVKSCNAAVIVHPRTPKALAIVKTTLAHGEYLDKGFIVGFNLDQAKRQKISFPALNFVAELDDMHDIENALKSCRDHGIVGISLGADLIDENLCNYAHNIGLLVFSRETSDATLLSRLVNIGVNFIITKDPKKALSFLPKEDDQLTFP